VSPEKRLDQAIEIARRSGVELKIAAKVDKVDRDYFEQVIRPLLSEPGIEFIGEIDERAKDDFLGNARALLFPIDWPEPFGLVMIESLACGTPVIARSCGSVPEIITNGVTGYICDALDEAVAAVHRIDELSRDVCRNVFQTRFSSERMAKDYVRIYQKVIRQSELTEVVDDGRSYSSPRPILHPRDIVTS
jgi:glycosyltransferase involved in cell wall biosynthesis